MDGELVSDPSSDIESAKREGGSLNRSTLPSYAEAFYAKFPYYLSIGMSEKQYWDDDSTLVTYYREAEQLRLERVNQEAWLQGMYVYDAITRVAPILRAFAKKGTKPQPYVDEPYPINNRMREDAEKKREKEKEERGMRYMQAFMAKTNSYFEQKGSE